MPPPIVIGCVNDAPAPVLEIVSGVDVTTEASVVGKDPGKAVPFSFTPVPLGAAGAVVDATTEVSSVGKRDGALAAGAGEFAAAAIGEGSGFCGNADSPARFAFSSTAC